MGAICSTTVPVGTRLHWSTHSPACMDRLRQDGQCCGREAQCGRRTKINWTKTAHSTRICICICGHLCLVPIHTHTHTPLCGYGLSTGPTEGLSSWWLKNRSPPRQPTTTTTAIQDVIKPANFCEDRLRGFGHFVWRVVEFWPFPLPCFVAKKHSRNTVRVCDSVAATCDSNV